MKGDSYLRIFEEDFEKSCTGNLNYGRGEERGGGVLQVKLIEENVDQIYC